MQIDSTNGTNLFVDFFDLSKKNPSMDLLREILHFFSKIPYENLTKIIAYYSKKNELERLRYPREVMTSFIEKKTGGTCFSLSYFLKAILDFFGFNCYLISADRTYGNDTHCGCIVKVKEEKFFLDPGFLKREPIAINNHGVIQVKSDINDIIIDQLDDSLYKVSTVGQNGLKYRYTLKDSPLDESSFIKIWINSFSLTMMNSLIYTRMEDNRQLYIRNKNLLYIGRDFKESKKLDNINESLNKLVGIDKEIVKEAVGFLENKAQEKSC
jgi:arylamine N-acetyltransferase